MATGRGICIEVYRNCEVGRKIINSRKFNLRFTLSKILTCVSGGSVLTKVGTIEAL